MPKKEKHVDRRSFIGMLAAMVPTTALAVVKRTEESKQLPTAPEEPPWWSGIGVIRDTKDYQWEAVDINDPRVRFNNGAFLLRPEHRTRMVITLPTPHFGCKPITVKNTGYGEVYIQVQNGNIDNNSEFRLDTYCAVTLVPDIDHNEITGETDYGSDWWLT